MSTDRAIWKSLDLGLYASNVDFVNVRQAMIDVHTKTYATEFWDSAALLIGCFRHVLVAKRPCKINGLSLITTTNVTASDVNFALFAVYTTKDAVFKRGICTFTTQTLAFGGPAPWGIGNLSDSVAFDPIAFTSANPTKPLIDYSQNLIEAGDTLEAVCIKFGAGVAICPTGGPPIPFSPACLTIDVEEL